MIYCMHKGCALSAIEELLTLADLTRRDDVRRVAVRLSHDEQALVRCRQVHRMQYEGAIEYDSWGRK